jgi:2-polyprenyl-3-methyl-5-hydroxy-6-metoxy-1,4-benzoquinol methylase
MNSCIICSGNPKAGKIFGLSDWEYGLDGSFGFDICSQCGVYKLDPMPHLEELKSYYTEDYHGFHTSNKGIITFLYKVIYKLRFSIYKKYLGADGSLLDVGCADAEYFDLLKLELPDALLCGVEFKDEIAEQGRLKGRNIITGTIEDCPKEKKYDLIIMNNLIEHVIDPILELRKANKLLADGGHIIIETPNVSSWDQMVFKQHWGGYHIPRHTYLFSPRSIKQLANLTGFKIKKMNFLLNTDHWALSVQNYLQSSAGFTTKIINGRCWYFKYLLFFFLPVGFVQKLFKKSGSITVILERSVEG